MHAYLSTQISQELRYYDLTCCGGVHDSESSCGKVWCKQSYTKHRLNTGCNWTDMEARTDLVIVDWNTEVTTTSSSSVQKKLYLSREWVARWDSGEKKGLRALPFSDN